MADGMTLTHRPLPSFCHAPITHTKYMRAAGVPLWSFCCGFASDRSVLSSTWTKHESNEPEWTTITRRSLVDVVQPSNLKVFCVLSLCIYFSSDVIKESANLAFVWSAVCRTNQVKQARTLMYCRSKAEGQLGKAFGPGTYFESSGSHYNCSHSYPRRCGLWLIYVTQCERSCKHRKMKSHCPKENLYKKPVSWRKTQPDEQSYG